MQPAHPLTDLASWARAGQLARVVAGAAAHGGPDAATPDPAACAAGARALLRLGRTPEALRWLEHGRHAEPPAEQDAMLLSSLAEAYRLCGKAGTAVDLTHQALHALPPRHPARPGVLRDAARASLDHGQPHTARALATESRDTATERDDRGESILLLGELALADADLTDARAHFTGLLRAARKAGHQTLQADATTGLARTLVELRDYPAGHKLHQMALTLHMDHGHKAGVAASLGGLGLCSMGQHVPAQGVQHLVRAVALCAELGHLRAEIAWRSHLDAGLVLLERTEWRIRELDAYLAVARKLGDRGLEAWLHTELGHSHRDIRDPDAALPCYDAAIAATDGDAPPALLATRRAHRALALAEAEHAEAAEALVNARAATDLDPALVALLDEAAAALAP